MNFEAVKTKCSSCKLRVKQKSGAEQYKVLHELADPWMGRVGAKVLVVFEQPALKVIHHRECYVKLKAALLNRGIRADFIAGIECEVCEFYYDKESEKEQYRSDWIPNPFYGVYDSCGTVVDTDAYDVIITVGKGLYAITRADDLQSWEEYVEYQFNPTFFYTGFGTKRKRVYPLPEVATLFRDNFETEIFLKHQLDEVQKYLKKNQIDSETEPYELKLLMEDPNSFLIEHTEEVLVALDIETSKMTYFSDMFNKDFEVICITLSFDGKVAYFLPFDKIDISILNTFLKNKRQLWANGKFDCKCLRMKGVTECRVDEDVILMFHMLSTERTKNSIKSLAWNIGFGGYDKELEDLKKEYKITDYRQFPFDVLAPYACLDPIVTYRLYEQGVKLGKLQPTVFRCYESRIKTLPAYIDMEISGIDINFDYMNSYDRTLQEKIVAITKEISNDLKISYEDIASPEKLGKALQKHKLPVIRKVKKGHYATGEKELLAWKRRGFEIADKIIEYRKLTKMRDTYVGNIELNIKDEEELFGVRLVDEEVTGLVKFICDDKKIHPIYAYMMADTLRNKCSAPNIQAFPSQGDDGKAFKPIIGCPGDEWYIMNMDYSGIQLRLGAIASKDKTMIEAYTKHGGDLHSVTAKNVFARDITFEQFIKLKDKEPYATYRFKSKSINFGLEFGAIEATIAAQLQDTWEVSDLEDYINKNSLSCSKMNEEEKWLAVAGDIRKTFFDTYPGLLAWIENTRQATKLLGYVDSLGGVRRHLPYLKYQGRDTNNRKYYGMLNICLNAPIQGGEAIIVSQAMEKMYADLRDRKMRSRFMSMIHDYIGFYVHVSEIKQMYHLLKSNCEDHTSYEVPLEVEISVGKIWEMGEKLTDSNIDQVHERLNSGGV